MRTIGLLGGMSWESSVHYERIINEGVRNRLGGLHSADLIVRSYDFARIEEMQVAGAWDEAGALLAADAVRLQDAGADIVLLCTNTMHRVAPAIEASLSVPFLHLADATATAVKASGLTSIGLLGTRFTMEEDFYTSRLAAHGLSVSVPGRTDRSLVDRVIFEELVRGVAAPESKREYLRIMGDLLDAGAQGVIAGCTEIELLVGPADLAAPYFPTTRLHAEAAVDFALAE